MQDRTNVPLVIFILLIVLAQIVILGVQAKSVWVSVLALVGVLVLFYSLGTARTRQFGGFWIGTVLGLVALSAAIWIGHMAGRFWWTPLFLFLSLMFLSTGISLHSAREKPTGFASVVIAVILFAFAIGGPWWLYGVLAGVPVTTTVVAPLTATADSVVRGEFFAGLWAFLLTAGKSGWGILYFGLVILLGRIWFGKWGWLIAPVALILAAGGLAWYKPGGAEPLTAFFTTAPLTLLNSALTASAHQFGSAAWGALLCGIGLVVLLLPAYIVMYSANRAMVEAQKVRQVLGTTIAANLLRGQYTPYTSLVSFVTVAASITGFILIWKALSGVAAASGALGFPLLGIADISLPRWKPIWQLPYFLNAGIYALVSLIATGIQRRLGLALISVNWFLVLLGSFILSLFVPAGVINFITGQSLVLCLVAPLSLLKKTKIPRPPVPEPQIDHEALWIEMQRRIAEQAAARAFEEAPLIEPVPAAPERPAVVPVMELEEDEVVSEPEMEGETLVDHGYAIVQMVADSSCAAIILDNYGDVYSCHDDGDESELASFSTDEPIGLAAISNGRIAVVDQPGKLFLTDGSPDTIDTASPIKAFTVNSFGTILAYTSPDANAVRGLIIAAGKDQLFIDCGKPLTAIIFSTDNRYLGIGTAEGKTLIFDMASRKITQTLELEEMSPVTHLRPTTNGWVVAYKNSRVAEWNNQGNLLHTAVASSAVTCLSVDPHNGNIAYGNDQGEITILNPQFEGVLTASMHDEDITSAIFESSGVSLVTAGIDGVVRRIHF